MDIATLNKLDNEEFQSIVGISRSLFFQIVKRYTEQLPRANRTRVLDPIYDLLITFIYYRNSTTMATLAHTYKVSSSSICRIVERVEAYLIANENIQLSRITEDITTTVDCT